MNLPCLRSDAWHRISPSAVTFHANGIEASSVEELVNLNTVFESQPCDIQRYILLLPSKSKSVTGISLNLHSYAKADILKLCEHLTMDR